MFGRRDHGSREAGKDLGSLVQLDVGSTCGDNDLGGYSGFAEPCLIEQDLELEEGEVRYLTVRPDADVGCDGKSCDYNYALWVRGPNGN